MHALRRLILSNTRLAALIFATALALRVLVPAGYMVSGDRGQITITICSGMTTSEPTMATAMPGMDHAAKAGHGKPRDDSKPATPCAFSSLSSQALGAIDPVLLAMSLAFVVTLALSTTPRFLARAASRLRPPLRGPPSLLLI